MIECSCGKKHSSILYELKPYEEYVDVYLNVIYQDCLACGKYVVELERTDKKGIKQKIKRFNQSAIDLYKKVEQFILNEVKSSNVVGGRFYLNYGEFGVKKKCYSNLSTLKMGLADGSIGIKEYQKEQKFIKDYKKAV